MEDRCIPQDLMNIEILPRLPVKSLLRFRSVCKAWYSTISSREFIESHRYHSQSKVHVVHSSNYIQDGMGDVHIDRLTEEGDLQHCYRLPGLRLNHIRKSSHDLVLLSLKDGYLLANPAMKEPVSIPHLPPRFDALLFSVVGFGFVSSLGKYKIVNIRSGSETQDTCEVFTVGMDNSWRIGKTPPSPICWSYGHTPYVNGNLHQLTHRNDKGGNSKIQLFNLEKEIWTMMTLPDDPMVPHSSIYCWYTVLREIQGLLCFTCCIENKSIDMWMLRDYENEVWSKDFVIDMTLPREMPNGVKFQIKAYYGLFPLGFMADGRILLETESTRDDRWLYDPRDGSVQLANHKGGYTTLYAENLVPISGF